MAIGSGEAPPRRLNQPAAGDRRDSDQAAIEVRGLAKSFGSLYALRGLSFRMAPGEFLTVFGPNGAGKTTLIRILATLTRPTEGAIRIGGLTLREGAERIRRRIGVIAHQTFLYEELTAEENLLFYARLYDLDGAGERIEEVLAEVGLWTRRRHRVRTFSRGMQQRLSIARAMLHRPDYLLLDEPYTGLDQHAAQILSGWLQRLKDRRRTILMVTHDLQQGLDLADRVAVLVQGKLVFDRAKDQIALAAFRDTYWQLVEQHTR